MVAKFLDTGNGKFTLNGVEFVKSFIAIATGDFVKVVSSYDSKIVLLPNTKYSEIEVGGSTFNTSGEVVTSLVSVIFSKVTLSRQEVDELKEMITAIGAGEGGKSYANLAAAQAVDPKPADGTVFQVEKTDSSNAGYHKFDSTQAGGTKPLRGFPVSKKEVLEASSNLFNKNTITDGYYLNTTGNLVADIEFYLTDFIPIEAGETYIRNSEAASKIYNLYDANKNWLEGGLYDGLITPSQGAFLRTAIRHSEVSIDVFQFCKGTELPPYEPFGFSENFKESTLGKALLKSGLNKPGGAAGINGNGFLNNQIIEFIRSSSNLFDPSARLDGFYVSQTGQEVADAAFYATDYIPVEAGKTYTKSYVVEKYYALFDVNKNFLSGGLMQSSVTANDNGFLRTAERYSAFDPNDFQICEGNVLPAFEPYGLMVREEKLGNWPKDQNNLTGKKLVVLGDSISYGFIPRNAPGYPGQLDSYAKLTAQKLGMVFQNKGISGSTVGALAINDQTNSPFVYRYQDLDDDAHIILVKGGTNDIRKIDILGTFNDTDETTFYGALHVLCLGLLQKYRHAQGTAAGKDKKIILITPIKLNGRDMTPYVNAVKEIGVHYSIPVWDAHHLSGINPHILKTVQGYEDGYLDMYNPYITDGTHPTQEGHEMMANALVGFINSI